MEDIGKEEKFQSRRQRVSLKNLYLDPKNYRFIDHKNYAKIDSDKDPTNLSVQSSVYKLVAGTNNDNIKDIIDSFMTNGYVEVDQIQVRDLGRGKYLVIEGNRRVTTLKYLESEYKKGNLIGELDSDIFVQVPVVIYTDSNEQHRRILMGLKHINGNKRWPAINQAQLLQDLNAEGMSEDKIRASLGITKLTYTRYIFTLKLVNDYKDSVYGDQFETTKFNIFAEIIKKPILLEWLGWNEKQREFTNKVNQTRLFSWLSTEMKSEDDMENDDDISDNREFLEPIITKGADLRELVKFIKDESALKEMEDNRSLIVGLSSSDIANSDKFDVALRTVEQQLNLAYNFSKFAKKESKDLLEDLNKKIIGLLATQEGSLKTDTIKSIATLNNANLQIHFSEITIENYKAFQHLKIEGLKTINLFAGTNNAGKSSLLEAIFFLTKQNDVFSLFDMYRRRGKFSNILPSEWLHSNMQSDILIKGLFNNFPASVAIKKENDTENTDGDDSSYLTTLVVEASWEKETKISTYNLYSDDKRSSAIKDIQVLCNVSYSSPFSMTNNNDMFTIHEANVVLNNMDSIVSFIQKNIDTKFKGVQIVTKGSRTRFLVNHDDFETAQDLTMFGDGLQRIFHITMQFAAARNGIVLLDEIENAIHFTLFEKLVAFIKILANKFNVQVFITSHSKECIDAFFIDERYNENVSVYNLSKDEHGNIVCNHDSGELFGELIHLINADARGGKS
jgi:AAA15 family ATPase/GTPase